MIILSFKKIVLIIASIVWNWRCTIFEKVCDCDHVEIDTVTLCINERKQFQRVA